MNSCFSIDVQKLAEEKPYKCNLCQKAFAQKQNLEYHARTHIGEKPYKCNLCQKAFARKQSLKHHSRTHTGEKPYRCNLCQKAFAHKQNLEYHTRTHTGEKPYKCNLCQKAFAQKPNLEYHTRTHTGEKPYKCNLCQKAFAQKPNLEYHKRTHTREKPYKCNLCHKAFASGVNLKKHMKSNTGEKLCHLSTSAKRVDMYSKDDHCVDGNVLSTEEKLPDVSSRQHIKSINPSRDENLCCENHSMINVYIDDFIVKPYGCGYCDEVFEIEKTFMDHCHNHYNDVSHQDTFLDLIEMCLLT